MRCSINKTVLVKYDTCIQALTNLVLSNARSSIPVLQICLLTYFHIKIFVGIHKAENVLHAFL